MKPPRDFDPGREGNPFRPLSAEERRRLTASTNGSSTEALTEALVAPPDEGTRAADEAAWQALSKQEQTHIWRALLEAEKRRLADEARRIIEGPEVGVLVSEVEREAIRWLWTGRLALGKLTILDGDPGLGKSTLYCDLAARLTTGRPWPDEDDDSGVLEHAGGVVIVSVEDDVADTIRPRLEEAGADLTRCLVVQTIPEKSDDGRWRPGRVPTLPGDLPHLEAAIERVGARLLVIDPLFAHLGTETRTNSDQHVRRALAPLSEMAQRLDVAVLVIRHLNKMQGGNPLYRGGGSIGIIGAARIGLLLARDPEDEERLVLASVKANIARRPVSLALRVVSSEQDTEVGLIRWTGPSLLEASALLSSPPATTARDEASRWLAEQLDEGPQAASQLYRAAEEAGISKRTLHRAKKSLGVSTERVRGIGGHGYWIWELPGAPSDERPTNHPHGVNSDEDRLRLPLPAGGNLSGASAPEVGHNRPNQLELGDLTKVANGRSGAVVKEVGNLSGSVDSSLSPSLLAPGMRVRLPDGREGTITPTGQPSSSGQIRVSLVGVDEVLWVEADTLEVIS